MRDPEVERAEDDRRAFMDEAAKTFGVDLAEVAEDSRSKHDAVFGSLMSRWGGYEALEHEDD